MFRLFCGIIHLLAILITAFASFRQRNRTGSKDRCRTGFDLFSHLQSEPLRITALLPLIAAYPVMTDIVDWEPIVNFFNHRKQRSVKHLNGNIRNAV